ncbi:MAG: BON domain-containing protein [Verrucomicrobia bacterium]|nr:BON domain-containing protein [Verrucomicrobiota bacterium]
MIRKLFFFLFAMALGAALVWYFFIFRQSFRGRIAERRVTGKVEDVGEAIKDGIKSINVEAIKDELARTGRVVREKAVSAGTAIADAATDVRITGAVKTKFASDKQLFQRTIGVSTTNKRVTLTGSVASLEEITRAMVLAYDTPDVTAVVSELRVGP